MQSPVGKPESTELITAEVLRSEQVTPNMVRVTLGRREIARFSHRGFDHWFRLFLPVAEPDTLRKVPNKLTTLSYLKFLTISKTERPILRNYTVRAFRDTGVDGPELDIDFVIHGSAADGTAGPASAWSQTCQPGDVIGLLDEGVAFDPPAEANRFRLVCDETALPAQIGIVESLPADATGTAVFEVPTADDQQDVQAPTGIEVFWIARNDAHATPGVAALADVLAADPETERTAYWVAGESALATGARRHWVGQGVDKSDIQFTGYWKLGKSH